MMVSGLPIDKQSMKSIGIIAGIVTVIIVGFYATGLYRNLLQIQQLKRLNGRAIAIEEF